MTIPTEVTVPVDLLQRIERSIIPSHPLTAEVRKYIPKMPAVGDTLTVTQIKDLPTKSVLRDRDGDVWVITDAGPAFVSVYSTGVNGAEADPYDAPVDYDAVLVSLPEEYK